MTQAIPNQQVLIVSPEPPYPLHGGGAYRIASLVHYFARFANVDLVLFSDSGKPAVLPSGVQPDLLRSQTVIPLPVNRNGKFARYLRNARRAFWGVPPLIDRLAGHDDELARALNGKQYDLGLVEHFWCAPYLKQVSAFCLHTVLDLHNVESVLHSRCAVTARGLVAAGQRRFARCAEEMEATLLPGYSLVLATSENDAATVRAIAPSAHVVVYPNAIPEVPVPSVREEPVVVFSGNFEYHPNVDAVAFLVGSIWPEVHRQCPELRLRLVGRGDRFVRHLLPSGFRIETTGPIENALAEIAAARIVVAPLRAGSGTRIKILEAWAAARPVIATSLAAEGLTFRRGEDLIVADGSGEFGAAIASMNASGERRAKIGTAGRRLFERLYTWEAAWRSLHEEPLLANIRDRYTEDSNANRR